MTLPSASRKERLGAPSDATCNRILVLPLRSMRETRATPSLSCPTNTRRRVLRASVSDTVGGNSQFVQLAGVDDSANHIVGLTVIVRGKESPPNDAAVVPTRRPRASSFARLFLFTNVLLPTPRGVPTAAHDSELPCAQRPVSSSLAYRCGRMTMALSPTLISTSESGSTSSWLRISGSRITPVESPTRISFFTNDMRSTLSPL